MARALAKGFVAADLISAGDIIAADAFASARDEFCEIVTGSVAAANNAELVEQSEIIFLSVKPQNMVAVMNDIQPAVTPEKLFISIAAGCTLAALAKGLATDRIIRVMPNTPCLVSHGASAMASAVGVTESDCELASRLLSSVGYATKISESLIDSVTGLSGSGPAYVYQVIEALSDGGVRMGLPREIATELAAHTVRGAAQMVLETGEHPAVLKDRVASPGGTTIAGLQALEQAGLRSALIAAVEAATLRSRELGTS